jgi:hypothetical protein
MRAVYLVLLFCCSFSSISIAQDTLRGSIDVSVLENTSLYPWFVSGKKAYQPDSLVLKSLQKQLADHQIIVVGGSWCDDTQYLLPKFYTLFTSEQARNIKLYMVGKNKTEGPPGFKIDRIPTFIVIKNDKEVGRIVESAKESIEKDLLKLFQN